MKTTDQGFELRGEITPVRKLLSDLWRARPLIRVMARRDFFVRYRRPSFGVMWAVGVPVIQAVVLSIVFTQVVRIETSIPYPLFVLSGIIPWSFFGSTIGNSVHAITSGSGIASKVYFPRAVLPLSTVGTGIYGFIPTLFVLIVAAFVLGATPRVEWLILAPAVVLMALLAAAFSLVFAALQVYFRDISFIVGALLQAWFYGSAVIFPVDAVPGALRPFIIANPATGMIEMFRIAFMGKGAHSIVAPLWTVGWIVALLIFAALLYRRYDRTFVDRL